MINNIPFVNACSMYFSKGVEYEVSAYLYNTASIDDSQFIAEFDFYLTQSSGPFPFKFQTLDSYGKQIGIAAVTQSLVPKYSPIFFSQNFIPDYDGTASLLIFARHGQWQFADISVMPFQVDNFHATEFEFKIETQN